MRPSPIKRFSTALFKKQFYIALKNIFRDFKNPFEVLGKYLFCFGVYPKDFSVRTPLGLQKITLYGFHDLITLVECFGKLDYITPKETTCVIDVGSNIGISALYFLTRNPRVRVFLYEPFPRNVDRLKKNLKGFEERYTLDAVAAGLENGTAQFAYESTGRYGKLLADTTTSQNLMQVEVKNINEIIGKILADHEKIGILKIDVEGLEDEIIKSLDPSLTKKIERIYAETEYRGKLEGFRKEQYGGIVRFIRQKNL